MGECRREMVRGEGGETQFRRANFLALSDIGARASIVKASSPLLKLNRSIPHKAPSSSQAIAGNNKRRTAQLCTGASKVK